ncbi:hypothetical protein PsorP6_006773 [Peronosclerospora sorghi]|uniref:Uncharacterized protein n=1 Tax=Peronosclerospora sorghi TaxID=230839 RepID=A0ACC0W4P3_9STRA|nr:hypothetical protein PsorP6_006773 [Peronosclerospora sorghi]
MDEVKKLIIETPCHQLCRYERIDLRMFLKILRVDESNQLVVVAYGLSLYSSLKIQLDFALAATVARWE